MDGKLEEFLRNLPDDYYPYAFKYRTTYTLSHYLKKAVRKLGLNDKLTVHSLKVSYVNKLKKAKLGFSDMHLLSHHMSVDTTMLYVRHDVDYLREMLEKSR
jgi:site-specific recombinase XerC